MTATDAAWLAGFIDGEGSIMLALRRATGAVELLLAISNTDRSALETVVQLTGLGAVNERPRQSSRHKTAYFWRCSSAGAESVIQQIRPYLRVKPRQADLALTFQSRLRDPAEKSDRSWQLAARETMQALNRRGPA
jgi:hypothetical protein